MYQKDSTERQLYMLPAAETKADIDVTKRRCCERPNAIRIPRLQCMSNRTNIQGLRTELCVRLQVILLFMQPL